MAISKTQTLIDKLNKHSVDVNKMIVNVYLRDTISIPPFLELEKGNARVIQIDTSTKKQEKEKVVFSDGSEKEIKLSTIDINQDGE